MSWLAAAAASALRLFVPSQVLAAAAAPHAPPLAPPQARAGAPLDAPAERVGGDVVGALHKN